MMSAFNTYQSDLSAYADYNEQAIQDFLYCKSHLNTKLVFDNEMEMII